MKILFITSLAVLIAASAPGQQTKSNNSADYSAYMKKSKNQKTAAWIFLGSGAVAGMTGLLITTTEISNNWWDVLVEEQKISPAGEILFYTGVAAMIGSIPLFIASTKNRKKAEDIQAFFRMRQVPLPGAYITKLIAYPSLTVTLKL